MKQSIIDNNYLIIKNFIKPKRAKKLSKEFKEYCEKNNIKSDKQIPNTPAKYNYISFLELLCEKTPEISEVIEETVLPTYCYSRVYKKGDVLKKHTDRDACEVSLTVHLDGDKDWIIYVQSPDKKEIPVTLKCGDALLYLGCDAPHWRNSFEGSFYSQVFLHYVRSRGKKSYAYFDNKDKDFFKLDNNVDDSKTKTKTKTKKDMKFITKASSKLENFIEIFEDIIPENLCDEIISQYALDSSWKLSRVSNDTVNIDVRNCEILSISSDESISKDQSIRKSIDDRVFEVVSNVIEKVCKKFANITISKDTGYDLLKYETGCFYTQHTDSFTDSPRAISCSLILNDDYEGGEFAFFDRELVYKLKKGSVIVFPSNYMYPHEVMPVTSGTRYSIITWFI